MDLTRSGRLWLCLPFAVLYALDIGVTLAGQDAAYWLGDHAAAIEGNPLAYPLLVLHPAVFVGAATAWLVAVVGLMQTVRARLYPEVLTRGIWSAGSG